MPTVALKSSVGKWVMASAILASSMAFIDGTALNVVMPALQKSLNATAPDLLWILNAYLLVLAALILIGGSLGDKLGRKKILMWGIVIFMAGSAACGLSPTVNLLIAFRILQGIGGALMIPGSLALISTSIDPAERGKAIGTWSAFTVLVTVGAPILGGALADWGLWRYIFFINIPIGIVTFLALWGKVNETRDEDANHAIDFPGAAAIALGLAAITFGFLSIPQVGFFNWETCGSLIIGVLLLIGFIIIEAKSKNPMMPLGLFSNMTFSGVNLLTFFLYAGLGAGMLFMSLNMVQVQGYSQFQSGLTFLPFTLLMIFTSRLFGSLADKYGPRLFLIAGPAIAGAGLFILSFVKQTNGVADYWTTFCPGIFVFGLGMAITVAPLTATVMGSVSDHFSGTASGINNAMTRISGVFANAIFGALAVLFFSGALQKEIKNMPFDAKQKQTVMVQAANLGNANAPATLNAHDKMLVAKAYHNSFIAAYANIMRLSAGLGFLGALMSILFISNKAVKKE
ncbi:MAG: MFS transporter [Sphingobacteriales bacterium]